VETQDIQSSPNIHSNKEEGIGRIDDHAENLHTKLFFEDKESQRKLSQKWKVNIKKVLS
jgi:hypothetical protein